MTRPGHSSGGFDAARCGSASARTSRAASPGASNTPERSRHERPRSRLAPVRALHAEGNIMNDTLTRAAQSVLADLCTPQFVRGVETAHDRRAGHALWCQLDERGLLDALVPRAQGGADLPLAAAAGVLFAFGQHALPLPAAHTMIARHLLAAAQLDAPRGPIALAIADASQCTAFVPYGQVADAVVVETAKGVWLVPLDTARVEKHGDGLDATVCFSTRTARALPACSIAELGAMITAATMAGAMQRVLDVTTAWVRESTQSAASQAGRDTTQRQLDAIAAHVAATRTAAQQGCAAHRSGEQRLASAIAKARASRAAPLVANGAHGLAGALGIVPEFDLQLFTRRLHAQRLQFGSESFWDEIVCTHAQGRSHGLADDASGIFDALDEAATAAH
ncbi:acyl-CoA dehydrogenase family protein [Paraburkholderia tropica]|uniref:acyl-CoA dehydrogenase family protein n=1 Tax=Paraburkholderia tropica TaxID=92647 RepID=UPI002AB31E37|nr:acyl-CoA dehydrogenase family protein [Paraburkholderia tropica]